MRCHRRRWLPALVGVVDVVTGALVIGLTSVMLVDVWLGIFFRYVLSAALPWTEELARYLMVWAGFLVVGLALKEGAHIGLDVLVRVLPPGARRAIVYPAALAVALFLATTVVSGVQLLFTIAYQRMPVLEISMIWPYMAIPVGALLMLFQLVVQLLGVADEAGTVPEPVA